VGGAHREETSGSIPGPSNVSMLAAIKPIVGRVSRWGVIPITSDQHTAGPMARTVTDAAIILGALESASPDPNDAAHVPLHRACQPRLHAIPQGRQPARCAHRHPARVLSYRTLFNSLISLSPCEAAGITVSAPSSGSA
jgi:Asp-tRNA(Asn)/Glu-tRNA(Gln) amidotransferase A subunit family amidase